jgi:hypothetical protein
MINSPLLLLSDMMENLVLSSIKLNIMISLEPYQQIYAYDTGSNLTHLLL